MIVIQGVINNFSVPSCFNDTGQLQIFQLLRDSRLLHLQQCTEITNAHFRLAQSPQNADPRAVAKKLKKIGSQIDREETSKKVEKLIGEKAFMIDQKKSEAEQRLQIKGQVDMGKTAQAIEKSIGEKTFLIEKRKADAERLKEIGKTVDMEKTADAIQKSVSEKGFMIEKRKESAEKLKEIGKVVELEKTQAFPLLCR